MSPLFFFVILLFVGLVLRAALRHDKPGYKREWSGQNLVWEIDRKLDMSSRGVLQVHRFASRKVPGEYLIDLEFKDKVDSRFGNHSASLSVEQARKVQRELDVILAGYRDAAR
ncbi:MAG: hypothetical protein AB8G16_09720 [Gammaproteobacteria bacterium]